jgi:serine phosphatase RsbU (regulator of sigma subunit)
VRGLDLPACISCLTTLSQRAETVMDELLKHARNLRGSHQLDDDFSIIEARFDHDAADGEALPVKSPA